MFRKILTALLVLAGTLVWLAISVSGKAHRRPENNPAWWMTQGASAAKGRVVVCIGDSITHGRVSHNYVDMLTERFADRPVAFVNAGVNSQLAWNVLQRLDEVVACQPDVVTVLIGTNDANAGLSAKNARRAMKKMQLARTPTPAGYRQHLTGICAVLKRRTKAKIALLSLPPIGEERGSAAWQASAAYSDIIRAVAAEQQVVYLPLNETMTGYLEAKRHRPRLTDAAGFWTVMVKGVFAHFVFDKSFDDISAANGFLLVTDFLHLNSRGAAMAADLIEGLLETAAPA